MSSTPTIEPPTEQTSAVDQSAVDDKKEETLQEKQPRDDNLAVQPQYIATARPESLGPLPVVVEENHPTTKKRPRDIKALDGAKICVRFLNGDCDKGDQCRFLHDYALYLASRPDDLTGTCPNVQQFQYCPYGVACRWGASHVNLATGQNLGDPTKTTTTTLNRLPRDVQYQLRKKQYPFRQARYNEAKKKETSNDDVPSETPAPTTLAPKPRQEPRKLIDFSNKVYVAPLTTVGNLPFRRILKTFGADITCGEMALATGLLQGSPSEWALLQRHPSEDMFGVQIAAGYPDQFARVCEVIESHMQVDFVDLNLGCPLDLVCNKGAGSSLMLRDNRLKQSLPKILATLSCPITIKMRTGWADDKPLAHTLVPKIQSWGLEGVAAIMVHGRSRLQRYSRDANWDYIAQVAEEAASREPSIPIIGNGDILSYTDYEEKVLAREGISSCAMLARGALMKPWLPTEIKERRHWDISSSERFDILKDFVRFGLEHWGSDQQGVNNTRRFLLEWLSFLHRYVPVGLLEVVPQRIGLRPPLFMYGRDDLETLMLSPHSHDWIQITERLLGPVPDGFRFEPKHKARAYK